MTSDAAPQGSLPAGVEELARHLRRLPGIGRRGALTSAIMLARSDDGLPDDLAAAIRAANDSATLCAVCMKVTDQTTCEICRAPDRRADQICVVHRTADIVALERTGHYRGAYHVLHGALDPLRGIGPDNLTLNQLTSRIGELRANPMAELILATANTLEGTTTADYIAQLAAAQAPNLTITTLGKGVGDQARIEFTDPTTMREAIANRSEHEV